MNDPNKALEVNLSSLLSLKAELLRKQAEVNKARAAADTAIPSASFSVPKSKLIKSDKKHRVKEVETEKDGTKVFEHEDSALLEKSKKVLEAKAKFYDRMTRSGGKLNSDDNCLVLFNRKKQEQGDQSDANGSAAHNQKQYASSSDSESLDEHSDDEDHWVEYTDCLGRTRKCLKKDIEAVKRRDSQLKASMPERLDQSKVNWLLDGEASDKKDDKECVNSDNADDDEIVGPMPPPSNKAESIFNDGSSMMSKHDEQRLNWERKEQENLDKGEVHYQDVFFDEARQHGVGYYAFSTDEEERRRQQSDLLEAREQTMEEQQRREALRLQREKIIAERVKAAKNRIRARLGLQPLEEGEEDKRKEASDKPAETKEERKARKRAEKLCKKMEAEEAKRELERKQHVRPWDKEKDGVKSNNKPTSSTEGFIAGETEWQYKPERVPLSQEEWNEQKRAERNPDFAPPQAVEVKEPRPAKIKRTNFTAIDVPPPPLFSEEPTAAGFLSNSASSSSFESYQTTTQRKHKGAFQRRSYQTEQEHVDSESRTETGGVAIPPPAGLDDTLPSNAKRAKTSIELERSIEAGLRFLRDGCDKGTLSTKSSWTAKADY